MELKVQYIDFITYFILFTYYFGKFKITLIYIWRIYEKNY